MDIKLPENITAVVSDERKLQEGCLFICCPITNYNGSASIIKAIRAGAAVIVAEKGMYEEALEASGMTEQEFLGDRPPRIRFVEDARYAMAFLYAAWYDHPARKMITIGITGTKGKTTVSYMIYEMLKEAGYKVGLIGTVEYIIGDEHIDSYLTSPEADILQEFMFRMAEQGTQVVVMEVASQALMTHRSQGFVFDIGIFTNIGEDHIGPDECHDFEHYVYCKSLLMRQCKTGIINIDDPYVDDILKGHSCEVKTYGICKKADLRAANISHLLIRGVPGVEFDVESFAAQSDSLPESSLHIRMPMPGSYSVSNALAAICAVRQLSVQDKDIVNVLERIYVKGRMNIIRPEQADEKHLPTMIVDFAHNPMSLRALLMTLRTHYSGKIIIVFGSVPPRDFTPVGEVCGELADMTVITMDNWTKEDPMTIMKAIEGGVKKVAGKCVIIPDRSQAVSYAVSVAGPDDVVVVAGRGHQNYQMINGKVVPFPSDEELLLSACRGDE